VNSSAASALAGSRLARARKLSGSESGSEPGSLASELSSVSLWVTCSRPASARMRRSWATRVLATIAAAAW
jgi:hypothetical protein